MRFRISCVPPLIAAFRGANAQGFGWVANDAAEVTSFNQQMYDECTILAGSESCVPVTTGKLLPDHIVDNDLMISACPSSLRLCPLR
jgi:hypothetical protein